MHFIRVSVAVLLGLFVCVILFSQISIHSSGYRNINNFSNQFHIDYINDYRQSPVTESFLIQADANNDNNNDILPNGKHKIYSPDLTAYVAIYTHFDTRYDEAHIQGVRTMYKTLQSSNPHNVRNRLVLVSENTPDSIRQLLISDGLIVKEMINTENEVSTCSLMFNRLHLWQLTEYKRVLFIENDVIVLRPLDEIFSCGKFCMVYNSIQHFTDAVFVVEPNIEIYHQLISAYNNIKFPTTALIVQGYCQEELWHFFLRIFGDLEASPLFEHQIQDYQRDEPLMRMQASISLNAMMWYEHFSWRLMRSPQFRNYTDEQGIPAYTLSFTTLKPYHWIPGLFFNLAWYWHDTSDKLLNKSYSDFLTISVISIMCLACFVEFGITRLFGALYSNTGSANARIFLPQLRRTGNALCSHYLSLLVSKIGVDHASIVVGAALTFILGYLLHFLIPITIPAHLAWPVFIFAHILLIYGAYKSIGLCYLYSSPAYKRTNSRRVSMADSNDNNTNIENDAVEIQSLLSNDINSPSAGQVVSGDESSSFDPRRKPTESDIAVPSEAGAMIRSTSANTLSNNMTVISNNTNTTAPTNNSNNNNNNNTNNSNNNNNNSAPAISSIQFTLLDMMYVLLWELLTFYFMRQTFYPEFVVKMFIVFPMVLCCFVSSINICYYIFVQLFGDVEDDIYDIKDKENPY